MSEATRQRWLHVKNRLEELARTHGPLEARPAVAWLDHLPETADEWTALKRSQQRAVPTQPAETVQEPSRSERGVEPAQTQVEAHPELEVWQRGPLE